MVGKDGVMMKTTLKSYFDTCAYSASRGAERFGAEKASNHYIPGSPAGALGHVPAELC